METFKYSSTGRKKTKQELFESELSKYKVKCKCGHILILIRRNKAICTHCGHYVYKDKQEEFRDRMKGLMK